jgi:CRP/FNR family transcriptional regulator, dissimilatory nitrate respiration regulator
MAELALSPQERGVLERTVLFAGLTGPALEDALLFFGASAARYPQGAVLQRVGEAVGRFGLVLSGTVRVCMDDLSGRQMILAGVAAGGTFGESLCYLGTAQSPVSILAPEEVSLLWLRTDAVRAGAAGSRQQDYADRFIAMLARRTLQMNDRIQVLSKLTLREKLLTFFTECARSSGGTFSIPFDRSSMAAYLGTERSALSRELGRMRREGLIDFYKNSFRLLRLP